jgi:hypothetical protein
MINYAPPMKRAMHDGGLNYAPAMKRAMHDMNNDVRYIHHKLINKLDA